MSKKMTTMAGALCVALGVQAGIVFQDDFSGTDTNNLHGTALDVNNQDAQTWRASTIFKADGSVNSSSYGGAYLDFAPTAGNVYTLKATLIANAAPNNNWIAVGFVRSTAALTGNNARHSTGSGANGIAWVLHRNNNDVGLADVVFRAGPNTGNSLYTEATAAASYDYVITLDATDSDNVLMSLNVAGSLEVDEYNAGTLASLNINGVGFSHDDGGNSSFDNFELSVIPEPGTLGLVTAFGGGVLFIRRRFMI